MERDLTQLTVHTALGHRPGAFRIDGLLYLRHRYGTEPWVVDDDGIDWPPACPDCRARLGELHFLGCGIEACPRCGRTVDGCGCVT